MLGNYERRQGGITLWDSRTGVPVKSLSNLPGFITSIDFSPDGSRFAASFGYQLYDTWENQPDGGIKAGNLLGTFGETRIWDLQSTTLPFTFKSIRGLAGAKEPHWTDPVTQANFNQDGTILVTVNQYHGNVEVCDADSLTRLGSLTVSSADDSSVYAAIPMSGSQVALILHNNKSSDASLNDTFTLEVWDWKSGRRLQVITTEAFDTLVYDTTDQSIEGVGLNGTLTKWKWPSNGQPVVKIPGPTDFGSSLDTAMSSRLVVYNGHGLDGKPETVLWQIDPDAIAKKICASHPKSESNNGTGTLALITPSVQHARRLAILVATVELPISLFADADPLGPGCRWRTNPCGGVKRHPNRNFSSPLR